ncbi:hypothetical protein CR513_42868, partial [Mucuna pruriens]
MDDRLQDMIHDIGPNEKLYMIVCNDAKKPLYTGCTNFTRLLAVLRLFNLKAKNEWIDQMMHQCLKCGESWYKKKNDDCTSDISTKGPPVKVLWCLPIILRFERLFANSNDAKEP